MIDAAVFAHVNIALKVRRAALFLRDVQVYAFFPDDTGPDVYQL